MKLVVIGLAVSLVVVAAGCSAKADFEKICNAEQLSGAASEPDPSTKAMKMADYLRENIHSSDAKKVMGALSSVSPDSKGALLKQAAIEAGYSGPCPIADMK